jgi:tetratricopeptide (TPR) repeat protein
MSTEEVVGEVVGFIALWDEALGPTVEDVYPYDHTVGDVDSLAVKIFLTFETVFGNSAEGFKRTNVSLPLNAIGRKASILLETIPNPDVRGGLQPFIVVLLLPENFGNLDVFEETMTKVAMKYKEKPRPVLRELFSDFMDIYRREMQAEEGLLKLEDGYSLTTAVTDFKNGVGFFQKKKFEVAYPLIRRSLVKFEQENQAKLIIEAVFLLSTIFIQQKRYFVARNYYNRLEGLAQEQGNQKYLEQGQFMQAYCSYMIEDYPQTTEILNRIQLEKTQFVNKLQYYAIRGRALTKLELFESAKDAFEQAIEISADQQASDSLIRQRAQIFFELGSVYFQLAMASLKTHGLADRTEMITLMDNAIEKYKLAGDNFAKLEDWPWLIHIYQVIGNISEYLGDRSKQLQYYREALEYSEKINDNPSKLKILKRIVQIQTVLGMHAQNVLDLQRIINEIGESAFIDLYSLAYFHQNLAENLISLQQPQDALSEYIIAQNYYKKFKIPGPELVDVLRRIHQIYLDQKDTEKATYYQDQIQRVEEQINKLEPKDHGKSGNRLGQVKEIWIFSDTGLELFDFAPETTMDPELLGGFLSALQSFSNELTREQLNAMVVGGDRYMIFRKPEGKFYIMGRANIKASEHLVEKTLKLITERFYKEYENYLANFVGNVTPFKKFIEVLNGIDFDTI